MAAKRGSTPSHMSFKGYDPCGREAARDAEGEDAATRSSDVKN